MDLREVGWRAWTGSIWLRIGTAVVNVVMNLRLLQHELNFLTSSVLVSFSGRPLLDGVSIRNEYMGD